MVVFVSKFSVVIELFTLFGNAIRSADPPEVCFLRKSCILE